MASAERVHDFLAALQAVRVAAHVRDAGAARKQLMRAHQLGDCSTVLHVRAHLALFRFEVARLAWRAALSQLALALGAWLFTRYTEAVVRPKLGKARAC